MRKRTHLGVVLVLALAGIVAPARDAAATLPPESHACGDEIDHSFRLSGNVGAPGAGCPVHGLVVTKPNITIDLGGNAIYGNSSSDILELEGGVWNDGHDGVKVINGNVRGFEVGIAHFNADDSRAAGIAATENLVGIVVHGANVGVLRSTASGNFDGIQVGGRRGVILGNTAAHNARFGFVGGGNGARFERNTASSNASRGFDIAGDGMTLESNTAMENGVEGLFAGGRRIIAMGNVAGGNADDGIAIVASPDALVASNRASGNVGDGIDVTGERARVRSNRSYGNFEDGIELDGIGSRARGNRTNGNGRHGIFIGDAVSSGVVLASNVAKGNGYQLLDGVGLGIDASVVAATVSGTRNVADGNEDTSECDPLTLC